VKNMINFPNQVTISIRSQSLAVWNRSLSGLTDSF
jgi:hypothetical protein